jgi:hypothetical protein
MAMKEISQYAGFPLQFDDGSLKLQTSRLIFRERRIEEKRKTAEIYHFTIGPCRRKDLMMQFQFRN